MTMALDERALAAKLQELASGLRTGVLVMSDVAAILHANVPSLSTSTPADRAGLVEPKDGWVLIKRGLYWRPNYSGYTGILAEAGIYSDKDSADRLDEGVTRQKFSEAAEVLGATFIDIERDYWREQALALRTHLASLPVPAEPVANPFDKTVTQFLGEMAARGVQFKTPGQAVAVIDWAYSTFNAATTPPTASPAPAERPAPSRDEVLDEVEDALGDAWTDDMSFPAALRVVSALRALKSSSSTPRAGETAPAEPLPAGVGVTDEMVRKAIKAFGNLSSAMGWLMAEKMRAALEAALLPATGLDPATIEACASVVQEVIDAGRDQASKFPGLEFPRSERTLDLLEALRDDIRSLVSPPTGSGVGE